MVFILFPILLESPNSSYLQSSPLKIHGPLVHITACMNTWKHKSVQITSLQVFFKIYPMLSESSLNLLAYCLIGIYNI